MHEEKYRMNQELLYLRTDTQAEPLFDNWYAWTQLISPATAARNVTQRHLRIMDSYISAAQFHANATKDPAMVGGPFIDYGGKRVEEIKALREKTKRDGADLIALSAALAELDANLTANAKGYSLQPLYQSVPEILKGYVELVYDLNNNPSFRMLEPLLYRSKFYDPSRQSLMLSRTRGDNRSFVLSTPRLEDETTFHWKIPFDHDDVDKLFRLETEPQTWETIAGLLGPLGDKEQLVRSFFTTEPPRAYVPYQGKHIRWRYFGHACILIEVGDTTLLVDPALSYDCRLDPPRYTYRDLPDRIDYVLLTHNHQDHVLLETLLKIRHKVSNLIVPKSASGLQDPSLKLALRHIGFNRVLELDELESLDTGTFTVTGLPFFGEHADLDIRSKIAYLVNIRGHQILFAADSYNIEPKLYEHIYRETGAVDTLFLGMECVGAPLSWVYGPIMMRRLERGMDESRRLNGSNFDASIGIVEQMKCKQGYVYAMGQEPWLSHVMGIKYTDTSPAIVESNKLLAVCAERGIPMERLYGQKEIVLDS
jgi:L-ascorbate metabolism protein UlaG (beta-lactamase superfamily)